MSQLSATSLDRMLRWAETTSHGLIDNSMPISLLSSTVLQLVRDIMANESTLVINEIINEEVWSQQVPSAAGFYWFKYTMSSFPHMREVRLIEGDTYVAFSNMILNLEVLRQTIEPDSWWAGPLKVPTAYAEP